MKNLTALAMCIIFSMSACHKTTDDLYAFPEQLSVSNELQTDKACLMTWEDLTLQYDINTVGKNAYFFTAKAWAGISEPININTPNGMYLNGSKNSFYVSRDQRADNNYVYVQLTGNGKNGTFGNSKIYRFKKAVTNGCVSWIDY